MAITSQYDNRCKDCGTEYKKGEQIDTNGNKSPNKAGEMKDHWCKMGKNCQGAMQIESKSTEKRIINAEPSVEELRKRFSALEVKTQNSDEYRMILNYIETREACEKLGITHPATIGMIWNNRVRDRQ